MKRLLVAAMVATLVVLAFGFLAPAVQAESPQQLACEGAGGSWDYPPSSSDPTQQDTSQPKQCNNGASNGPSVSDTIKAVINIMLFAVGVIAVIVIVVSAVRFVNSGGDTQQVSKAKDAVIYALVGVVIAASAFAIVNFVLGQL